MDNLLRHSKVLLLALVAVVLILPGASVAAQDSEPTEEPEPAAQGAESTPSEAEGEVPIIELQSGEEAAADQIIVKFEPEASGAAKEDVRSDEGLEKKEDLDLIDAEVVKVEDQSIEDTLSDLNNRSEVVYAEPDYVVYQSGYKDESRFGELWGLDNTEQVVNGGSKGTADVDINAPEAAAVTQGDENLVVAVVDGGVDITHPELKDRAWTNPGESGGGKETNRVDDDVNGKVDDVHGWDFVNRDGTVYDRDLQEYHGTHVAGTIASSADRDGVVGVAPNVQIMALKFLGPDGKGLISNATAAIEYSVDPNKDGNPSDGAKISNNSWECTCTDSSALKGVVDASNQLVVAAAGNSGVDNDASGASAAKPASLESPNVLSVAAIDNKGNLANFSNYGAEKVDISAPGVDILSSSPGADVSAVTLSNIPNPGQIPQGRALVAGFGVDEIGDKDDRTSFMQKAFDAVGRRANQDVVLVDDDGSDDGSGKSCLSPTTTLPDTGSTLTEAIKEATGKAPISKPGANPVRCGSALGSGESFDTSKILVWATGAAPYTFSDPANNSFVRNLTERDRNNLDTFLSNGGRLILTGMDALNKNENETFVTGAPLRLRVQSNVPAMGVFNGSSGTNFAGAAYKLNGTTNDPDRHDRLIPNNINRVTTQGTLTSEPSWKFLNGTSMAAPHATGAAALAASTNPALLDNPKDLKQAIMDGGKEVSATGGKTVTGDMVDARAALTKADKTAPQISGIPSDTLNVEATSKDGAAVTFTATATDNVDGNVPVSCASDSGLKSGDTFPLDETTVDCSATDKAGNKAEDSFKVSVKDTTAPELQLPENITKDATSKNGTEVEYEASASDVVDGTVEVSCSPASGSTFPIGETTVDCSATDEAGNKATGGFKVTVRDGARPTVECGTADDLWRKEDVNIKCTANDGESGLNNPDDASFSLSTNVANDAETDNASTGSREVCDKAGNCALAGPIDGIKVDKKAPQISITAPKDRAEYALERATKADYACTDGGSGTDSCAGPVVSGGNIDTSKVGPRTFTVETTDKAGNASSQKVDYTVVNDAYALVIDSDAIGKGAAPNNFSDRDVNVDVAGIGAREPLRYFAANVGKEITLYSGQVGDEGMFALETIPSSWAKAGPTSSGLLNYIKAGPGLGSPNANGDREALLDKVPDVTPLRATGLKQLVGQRVYAVVSDSDVGVNYGPLNGSLKGKNLGVVAFEVLEVQQRSGASSGSLPQVRVKILDAGKYGEGLNRLPSQAPAPRSSSEPMDTVP